MATSTNDLKDRLNEFLSGATPEQDFRVWFAFLLRDIHEANDPDLESLAHQIQMAFSESAVGNYTSKELAEVLSYLTEPTKLEQGAVRLVPCSWETQTKDEWLTWAVPKYEEFNISYPNESPNVARMGDQGHYELGNIELVTAKENREVQVVKRTEIVHGTVGGYFKEKRRNLEICDLCLATFKEYTLNYRQTHIRKRDRDKMEA